MHSQKAFSNNDITRKIMFFKPTPQDITKIVHCQYIMGEMKKAEDTAFFFASVWTCKTDINPEYLINNLIIIFIDVTKTNYGHIAVATLKAGFENYFLSIKLSVKECTYLLFVRQARTTRCRQDAIAIVF